MRYNYERRQYKATNWLTRAAGGSTVDIECPFCGTVTRAFVWSLAGSGKRCSSPGCCAVHEWLNQTTRKARSKKDAMIEAACAAYWWHDSPMVLTWQDLVEKDDYRLPVWRAKMKAALEAAFAELES